MVSSRTADALIFRDVHIKRGEHIMSIVGNNEWESLLLVDGTKRLWVFAFKNGRAEAVTNARLGSGV